VPPMTAAPMAINSVSFPPVCGSTEFSRDATTLRVFRWWRLAGVLRMKDFGPAGS
jgi:hypothetical protein